MGCNSTNEKRKNILNGQNKPMVNENYFNQKPPIIIYDKPQINNKKSYSKISNTLTTNCSSKGISSKKTPIYNKILTENEFKNLEYYYLNLISRAFPKKTIDGGGQAKIKKCFNAIYNRWEIEKVLNIDTLGEKGKVYMFNLAKEGILLSGLNHPNVIKIYGIVKDYPAIRIEYCPGGSLRKFLDKHSLSPLFKIYLIYSICEGLKYVHSKLIVHGDLKCDNILLSDEKKKYCR